MKKLLIALGIAFVLILGTFGTIIIAAPPDKPVDTWDLINDIYQSIGSAVTTTWTTVFQGLEAIFDEVDDVEEDVSDVQDSVDDLTSDVATVQSTANSILTEVYTVDSDVGTVNSNLGLVNGTVNSIEEDVASVQSSVDSLTVDVGDVQTSVNNLLTNSTGLITDQGILFIDENNDFEYVYQSGYYPDGAHFHVTVEAFSLGSSDYVTVAPSWSIEGEGSGSVSLSITNTGFNTYEFDAYSVSIFYHSEGHTNGEDPSLNMTIGWGVTTTYTP